MLSPTRRKSCCAAAGQRASPVVSSSRRPACRAARWLVGGHRRDHCRHGRGRDRQLNALLAGGGPAVLQQGDRGTLSVRERQHDRREPCRLQPAVQAGRTDRSVRDHPSAGLRRHHATALRSKTGVGISSGALGAFQLAQQIRDGMFAGEAQPQMRFALKPLDLDTGARRAVLDLDGQTLSYDHGPAQPASMEWPGPNGRNVVRLTFIPLDQQTPLVTSREGAWSWFRLLPKADRPDRGAGAVRGHPRRGQPLAAPRAERRQRRPAGQPRSARALSMPGRSVSEGPGFSASCPGRATSSRAPCRRTSSGAGTTGCGPLWPPVAGDSAKPGWSSI